MPKWSTFHRTGDIIEIKIKDCNERAIERRVANTADSEEVIRIVAHIFHKYGIPAKVITSENKDEWFAANEEFKW